MKRTGVVIGMLVCFSATAQTPEMEQLKLDLEKLAQFRLILSQMKQGYETLQNGYNAVRDAAKGNFELHKNYLDGLLVVNSAVRNSPTLQQIADNVALVIKSFQMALQQYSVSGVFTGAELTDLRNRYNNCLQRINDDMDIVSAVTASGNLRMSDAERLQAIGTIQTDVSAQLANVQKMISDQSKILTLRQQRQRDNNAVKKLLGAN